MPNAFAASSTSASATRVSEESARVEVGVARTLAEIGPLRTFWNEHCDDPASDLDLYLASAARRVSEFQRPHLITVYRDGLPDCMLAGLLERCPVPLRFGSKTVAQPMACRLYFPRGSLFGNATDDNLRLIVSELKAALRRREADTAEFASVPTGSALASLTQTYFSALMRGHYIVPQERWWIDLPASFDHFLANLPRRYRHEYRRHKTRLADNFFERMEVRCYTREDDIDRLIRDTETVSATTYQRAMGVGFQPNATTIESFRVAARQGRLQACILYLEDQPSAYFIGKRYRSTFFGICMGYTPRFAKYSPGLIMLMHAIEHSLLPKGEITRFDLGFGAQQYKHVICNRFHLEAPTYLYAFNLKGQAISTLRSALGLLETLARNLLLKSSTVKRLVNLWKSEPISEKKPPLPNEFPFAVPESLETQFQSGKKA